MTLLIAYRGIKGHLEVLGLLHVLLGLWSLGLKQGKRAGRMPVPVMPEAGLSMGCLHLHCCGLVDAQCKDRPYKEQQWHFWSGKQVGWKRM